MRGAPALQRGTCITLARVLLSSGACLQTPSRLSQQGRCTKGRSAASCCVPSCTYLLMQNLLMGFGYCIQNCPPHHDCV